MILGSINAAQALLTLALVVAASLVILAHIHSTSRKLQRDTAEDMERALEAKEAANRMLEAQVGTLQAEGRRMQETVRRLKADLDWYRDRFLACERRCEQLERAARAAGLAVPPEEV